MVTSGEICIVTGVVLCATTGVGLEELLEELFPPPLAIPPLPTGAVVEHAVVDVGVNVTVDAESMVTKLVVSLQEITKAASFVSVSPFKDFYIKVVEEGTVTTRVVGFTTTLVAPEPAAI
jgi:hypothetical protein